MASLLLLPVADNTPAGDNDGRCKGLPNGAEAEAVVVAAADNEDAVPKGVVAGVVVMGVERAVGIPGATFPGRAKLLADSPKVIFVAVEVNLPNPNGFVGSVLGAMEDSWTRCICCGTNLPAASKAGCCRWLEGPAVPTKVSPWGIDDELMAAPLEADSTVVLCCSRTLLGRHPVASRAGDTRLASVSTGGLETEPCSGTGSRRVRRLPVPGAATTGVEKAKERRGGPFMTDDPEAPRLGLRLALLAPLAPPVHIEASSSWAIRRRFSALDVGDPAVTAACNQDEDAATTGNDLDSSSLLSFGEGDKDAGGARGLLPSSEVVAPAPDVVTGKAGIIFWASSRGVDILSRAPRISRAVALIPSNPRGEEEGPPPILGCRLTAAVVDEEAVDPEGDVDEDDEVTEADGGSGPGGLKEKLCWRSLRLACRPEIRPAAAEW